MSKGELINELKIYRSKIPKQTLKTIRGQAIAGDVKAASKGLSGEIKKLEQIKLEECFAYRRGKCKILVMPKCQGINCPFYKTKNQFEEDHQKAIERILSLDKRVQEQISVTYYKGRSLDEC